MGNKEWDNYLRDILGDFKSEGGQADWEAVARQYDAENINTSNAESIEDGILKEKLTNYTPDGPIQGWERIESSLDASDAEFDRQVRARIHAFHLPKDPHSWQHFLRSFSKHKMLRAKLIALKVFESAAVVLLLITILHMGHTGRLPLISSPNQELAQSDANQSKALNTIPDKTQNDQNSDVPSTEGIVSKENEGIIATSAGAEKSKVKSTTRVSNTKKQKLSAIDIANTESDKSKVPNLSPGISEVAFITPSGDTGSTVDNQNHTPAIDNDRSAIAAHTNHKDDIVPILPESNQSYITPSLSSLSSSIESPKTNIISDPIFVATVKKPIFEFGMLVQADYNQLKLPGDKVYNNGGPVVFPLQGLTSSGYGAGFTLAIGHPRWALETGLIYNAKSFKPGREITIGGVSDHSNVEFDAIHMQLISMPLQFRYRFDPKGRLKAYALGGFGLHLITQSDIDVMVEYNFASLNPGENPKNNPSLARTIRETERVSDDFREKAPFSSQSYISANLGIGLEYALSERKTLFLQTAYQYQIPNLRFSNHNGKHLLSLSLQAGVRTPLGT